MARVSFNEAVVGIKEDGYTFEESKDTNYKYKITKGSFVEVFTNGREVVAFFKDTHPQLFAKKRDLSIEAKANRIAVEYAVTSTTQERKQEIQREMYDMLAHHNNDLHEETRSMLEQMCYVGGSENEI